MEARPPQLQDSSELCARIALAAIGCEVGLRVTAAALCILFAGGSRASCAATSPRDSFTMRDNTEGDLRQHKAAEAAPCRLTAVRARTLTSARARREPRDQSRLTRLLRKGLAQGLLRVRNLAFHKCDLKIFIHINLFGTQVEDLVRLAQYRSHLVGRLADLHRSGWRGRRGWSRSFRRCRCWSVRRCGLLGRIAACRSLLLVAAVVRLLCIVRVNFQNFRDHAQHLIRAWIRALRINKLKRRVIANVLIRIAEQCENHTIDLQRDSRHPKFLSGYKLPPLHGLRRRMSDHAAKALQLLMYAIRSLGEPATAVSVLRRYLRRGGIHQQLVFLQNQYRACGDDVALVVRRFRDLVLRFQLALQRTLRSRREPWKNSRNRQDGYLHPNRKSGLH